MISSYTFDGNNLRQSKTVNGVVTNHIWDGMHIVAETRDDGDVFARYWRGLGGEPVSATMCIPSPRRAECKDQNAEELNPRPRVARAGGMRTILIRHKKQLCQ